MMQLKQDAAYGVKWNTICRLVQQVVGFLSFLLFARILQPQAFGLVALAGAYVGFLEYFVSQGLGMAIVQKKDLQEAHLDSAFWMCVATAVLLSCVTWGFSLPISRLLGDGNIRFIVMALSVSLILSAMSTVQGAVLTREMKFKELAFREMIAIVCGSIIGVSMAVYGFGAWSLVGQQIGRSFIGVIVLWKVSHWRPGLRLSMRHFRELFSYSWAVLSSNLVRFFSDRGDQLIIGRVLGTIPLGYFSIARKISNLLHLSLVNPIAMVTLPIVSKIQDDRTKVAKSIQKGLEIGSLFSLPILLGIFSLAPDFTVLAFGEKWADAGDIVRILMLGQVVSFFNMFSYPVFMSMGKPDYCLWMISVKSVCTVVASLSGLRWGLSGVAWGVVVAEIITTAFSVRLIGRIVPLTFIRLLTSVRVPLMCSIMMSVFIYSLHYLFAHSLTLMTRVTALVFAAVISYPILIRLSSLRLFSTGQESMMLLLGIKSKNLEAGSA